MVVVVVLLMVVFPTLVAWLAEEKKNKSWLMVSKE
jgi:hypothetical protein